MKKIIYNLINESLKRADVYQQNGSIWLVFTDRKEWVLELKTNGNLWYNYNIFKNMFNYVSLDIIKNQHYITEWVEDFIRDGVIHTNAESTNYEKKVDHIIKSEVKYTLRAPNEFIDIDCLDYIIQNGTKHL